MLKPLRNLFRNAPEGPRPSTPAGTRFYAIGDIHGCDRLFDALIDAIEADDAQAGQADTTVIMLSGFARDQLAERSLRAGAAAYVEKGEAVADVVGTILAHESTTAPMSGA